MRSALATTGNFTFTLQTHYFRWYRLLMTAKAKLPERLITMMMSLGSAEVKLMYSRLALCGC
jgi:hypothetical protein